MQISWDVIGKNFFLLAFKVQKCEFLKSTQIKKTQIQQKMSFFTILLYFSTKLVFSHVALVVQDSLNPPRLA